RTGRQNRYASASFSRKSSNTTACAALSGAVSGSDWGSCVTSSGCTSGSGWGVCSFIGCPSGGLARFQRKVDRAATGRLVQLVRAVEEVEDSDAQIDRVEQAPVVAVEGGPVCRVGQLARHQARFEQRLAQPVDQIVNEREAVVCERALDLNLKARLLDRRAKLLARVKPRVV